MSVRKSGILGFDHDPDIDPGTMALTCMPCPGITSYEEYLRAHEKEEHDRHLRDRQIDKEFVPILRDVILDYQVDKRKKWLRKNDPDKIGKIRCKTSSGMEHHNIRHRKLKDIDALVLHQTAFDGGNLPVRYYDLSVHFIIVPNGVIYQNHSESVRTHGSSGFNKKSVAVEFVGNFKAHDGQWWKGTSLRSTPTMQQIISGRKLVDYLKRSLGIKYVYAHRQALYKKGNCPGPEIWFNVGEWALKNGLSEGGKAYKIDSGQSIPKQWRDEKFNLIK